MSAGILYIIRALGTDYYKIGITRGLVQTRIDALACGCPHPLCEVTSIRVGYVGLAERSIHLAADKYHTTGEWFEMNKKQLDEVLQKLNEFSSNPTSSKSNLIDARLAVDRALQLVSDTENHQECLQAAKLAASHLHVAIRKIEDVLRPNGQRRRPGRPRTRPLFLPASAPKDGCSP